MVISNISYTSNVRDYIEMHVDLLCVDQSEAQDIYRTLQRMSGYQPTNQSTVVSRNTLENLQETQFIGRDSRFIDSGSANSPPRSFAPMNTPSTSTGRRNSMVGLVSGDEIIDGLQDQQETVFIGNTRNTRVTINLDNTSRLNTSSIEPAPVAPVEPVEPVNRVIPSVDNPIELMDISE